MKEIYNVEVSVAPSAFGNEETFHLRKYCCQISTDGLILTEDWLEINVFCIEIGPI